MKNATPPTIAESYSSEKGTVIVIKAVNPSKGWSRKATSAYFKAKGFKMAHGFHWVYPAA